MGVRSRAAARLTALASLAFLTACASSGVPSLPPSATPSAAPSALTSDAVTSASTKVVAGAQASSGAAGERAIASRAAREASPWQGGEGVTGVDVSRYQENVDWDALVASGEQFVYIKATEGTAHRSPTHDDQRAEARAAGLVQGAYHYARPAQSSGTLQARFFHANGGAWSPGGRTLPGALDLEFAEEGDRCHGLDEDAMSAWIRSFSDEYLRLSGRTPVIYTSTEFWQQCTGGDVTFSDHALWLFDHADTPGTLPSGWTRPTLWQRGVVASLDRNTFFGTTEQLAMWASSPLG